MSQGSWLLSQREDVNAVITQQLINKHKIVYYYIIVSNIMSKTVSSLETVFTWIFRMIKRKTLDLNMAFIYRKFSERREVISRRKSE